MSVEALAISAIVEEGASALRTLYANGVTSKDFVVYEEEFEWIEQRASAKKPINMRIFRQRFAEFDGLRASESVKDLAISLKEERAFTDLTAMMATLGSQLQKDNAVELAMAAREKLSEITRAHAPMSDFVLEDWEEEIAEMRRWREMEKQGIAPMLKTGFAHLDNEWGGLLPGQLVQVLGRTGEGKSLKTVAIALNAKLQDARVGLFSPEMSRHEIKSRLMPMASAKPEIKEAAGLDKSFRNRALLHRSGFNIKVYERFCQFFEQELPGKIHLLAGTHRQGQMTVGYIEDRIVDLGLDLVIIDPVYLLRPVRFFSDNQQAEIGATSYALAALAETYNIPIIITNQANRQGATGDAPHKDRSYNSDIPNHVSDYVLGVKHVSEENRMICRCTKSRHGQEFRYDVICFPNTGVWKEITPVGRNYFNGSDDVNEEELKAIVEAARQ